MPTPGYVFRDGQPIPDAEIERQENQPKEDLTPVTRQSSTTTRSSPINTPTSSNSTLANNAPTESHALAEADHEEKGAAQEQHFEAEVKNLGWHDHPDQVKPLVGGLRNDDLWMLVRRFNKVFDCLSYIRVKRAEISANVPCKGNPGYTISGFRSQHRRRG